MVDCLPNELRFVGRMENGLYRPHYENPRLEQYVTGFPREDVAAAVQRRLEEVVSELIDALPGDDIKIALAGGIFANVKLNQRVAERPRVADVYVFPNMGDGGLSVGAAWQVYHQLSGLKPEPFAGALLGNEIGSDEILRELQAGGLDYDNYNDIGAKTAELLAEKHPVIRVAGRMEYGPRALGNRSILCHASDASINDWLNKRLQRSEFMPFAPVTLVEHAEECYLNAGKAADAARFMTVTYDCKPAMKAACPAAVHVDGTARPQIVDKSYLSRIACDLDAVPRDHRDRERDQHELQHARRADCLLGKRCDPCIQTEWSALYGTWRFSGDAITGDFATDGTPGGFSSRRRARKSAAVMCNAAWLSAKCCSRPAGTWLSPSGRARWKPCRRWNLRRTACCRSTAQ